VCFNTPFPFTQQREAVFFRRAMLATALSSSDPLLSVLNHGNSFCTSALLRHTRRQRDGFDAI